MSYVALILIPWTNKSDQKSKVESRKPHSRSRKFQICCYFFYDAPEATDNVTTDNDTTDDTVDAADGAATDAAYAVVAAVSVAAATTAAVLLVVMRARLKAKVNGNKQQEFQ